VLRVFTRQREKLGSEEGQALGFVAMVGLVVFLFFAMTMNVAELFNTKIKNQNVADATALSGAVWEARFLNLISGSVSGAWLVGLQAFRRLLPFWRWKRLRVLCRVIC